MKLGLYDTDCPGNFQSKANSPMVYYFATPHLLRGTLPLLEESRIS